MFTVGFHFENAVCSFGAMEWALPEGLGGYSIWRRSVILVYNYKGTLVAGRGQQFFTPAINLDTLRCRRKGDPQHQCCGKNKNKKTSSKHQNVIVHTSENYWQKDHPLCRVDMIT